jgi:hypothetical protein
MNAPAAPAGIGSNSLPELASSIVREHEAIQNAPHVVPRAIALGELLIEAKNHDGQYGKWSKWLNDNCRRFMALTRLRVLGTYFSQIFLWENWVE